ncbi:phosphate acetyltransferase [Sulfuriroseicoccus oceanibius]|uniref:Phosphate acetyltransferase n=1 Tax=Sulfuriroseicoccus oceanibius TaxID=2707525 RepID=A0A6B3L8D4_9BACT|nr:phosphate acetyltransferase [Sulfuriroseicoccus oceanibius]QQL45993.1 phosphate acetyltransferase [Sulfuriroseicoccus oceanibius]
MRKHTFLTIPVGRDAGLTSASIGLVRTLDRLGVPVGFFKPLSQPHPGQSFDRSSAYLEKTNTLFPPPPIPTAVLDAAISDGTVDDLMEEVVQRFEELPAEQETVVVEGMVPTAQLPTAQELNGSLARALNAEVVLVARPSESSVLAIRQLLTDAINRLPASLIEIKPAVILNHVDLEVLAHELGTDPSKQQLMLERLRAVLTAGDSRFELIGLIGSNPDLAATRVVDIVGELQGEVLVPGDMHGRRVKEIRLCARNVGNLFEVFKSGTLVVTPGDRSDVISAAALAATKSIHLAGIVLTGGMKPCTKTLNFCKDAFALDGGLPIFEVSTGSFETARALTLLNPEVPVEDVERVNLVMDTFARGVDSEWLRDRCDTLVEKRLSPPAFRHRLSKMARDAKKTIVLPEGDEPRTVQAAVRCAERGIAECVLVGDPRQIHEVARVNELEIGDGIVIVDPAHEREKYLKPLLEMRKHKGLTEERAIEALRDNVTLATMMVALGEVDGLVSGAVHSTASTIRPALQLIKTAPDANAVSSIFFMCLPDQVLVYGDCAVNPDPDAEMLADIAIQSARSAKAFGIEPTVAMISYSTLGSGSGANVDKVVEATKIARERAPELVIDGPLQYDAATIPSVAKSKAPDSPVAGRANVCIFPDLNTGNTTYKAVQRAANVISMGPMLQGLRRPVNDLSRGALVDDIIYTIALTAIQAQQVEDAELKQ